ncbi:neprilysin-like isoform X1 [Temnothorax curvispinosus]|uniref:Neprilysin-like isoform X1 n=1 Tax=Temnothorax curvispinosus TaxID=300111 RepID=A0A6J1QNH3_9HYME|nr:neprilysin-like isoform X1 [Temnothorax curvispinosus]
MRWFILLAFIGVLLLKNATPSKNLRYPSRLDWLFGVNNEPDKNKEENKEKEKKDDKPTVCQSQECKKIARIISESMNKSADPCDDFYEYACGRWPEHNPIPNGLESWSMFRRAQINVQKQIKEILDEGPKKNDLLAVKLAKKWYAVCMDTDAMERYGLEPLVFTLSRIGGWPLIMEQDEWNEQEYSWQKVDDQYVRLTGRNAFYDVSVVNIDYDLNETRKVVYIDIPDLPTGSNRLWSETDSEEEEDKSDEDASNEQKDSQEPGSKEKNDDKSGNNRNDENEDDNNDESDNNDDEKDNNNNDKENNANDTNKQNDDDNAKKKVSTKRTGKLAKNKKLGHGRKMKSNTHSKNNHHKTKKEGIKKRAIPTNIREKLRVWKTEKNHVKQKRIERPKETLKATTPQDNTKEMIDEDNDLKKYTNYISKVAHAIAKTRGVEVSEEHMNKDIQDIIEFQVRLAEITAEADVMRYRDVKSMTLNDFQKWYNEKKPKTPNSAINWVYKIGELFDEAHVQIGDDLTVGIRRQSYFRDLVALLDKTSSRTIVNYIHWNFLIRIIKTTTSEMRKLYYAWEGKEEKDDKEVLGISLRSRKCTREVAEMSVILAYEYVRNHFSDEITKTASDMVDDMQIEVEYQIKESNWMDEDTKDFVLAKLVNLNKFIGYPDWFKNNTKVKQYFQGLVIGKSYYENILSYDRYSKWKNLRELLLEDDENADDIMMINPTTVDAYFSPGANSIAISAADFQSPLFAYGRPQVINYGIIGMIMGHEVNHGFDNRGHLYDKNGNAVEWLSAMAEAYGKRAECFVEQFNNYSIDKTSNYTIENYGNQTAGENIADTMGLEAAFKAYQRRQRECGKPDTVLPGLEDLTNDQLFFLSFANLCCEAAKMNSTINKAKRDPHSPGRLRIIGSVSNSQDFAEAYNCPIGSAMNPSKKCHIWK